MAHELVLLTKRAKLQGPDKKMVAGVFSVHPERVAWRALETGVAVLPVSCLIAGITNTQRAKGKPFLRLAAGAVAYIFEFDSEADRDAAVERMSSSVASGGGGGDAHGSLIAGLTPQQRKAILKEQPDQAMLYQNLVGAGILTETEFWARFRNTKPAAATGSQSPTRGSSSAGAGSPGGGGGAAGGAQKVGIQNAMLQLKAVNENNQLTIKVSEADKAAIFAEKPHVARAHAANVPANMTEAEFWRRYYVHEEGKKARRKAANEQGCTQYAAEDGIFNAKTKAAAEDARAQAAKLRRLNPSLNLAAQGNEVYTGFGLAHNEASIPTALADVTETLAHDINRHAEVVLQRVHRPDGGSSSAAASPSALNGSSGTGGSRSGTAGVQIKEEPGMEHDPGLEDLRATTAPAYETLNIVDPRRYFERAASGGDAAAHSQGPDGFARSSYHDNDAHHMDYGEQDPSGRSRIQALMQLMRSTDGVRLLNPPCPVQLAQQVLWELTSAARALGDVDRYGQPTKAPSDALPSGILDLARATVLQVYEMGRHFWAAMPATTVAKVEKATRLQRSMEDMYAKVEGMVDAAKGPERAYIRQLLKPARDALEAALARFDQDVLERATLAG